MCTLQHLPMHDRSIWLIVSAKRSYWRVFLESETTHRYRVVALQWACSHRRCKRETLLRLNLDYFLPSHVKPHSWRGLTLCLSLLKRLLSVFEAHWIAPKVTDPSHRLCQLSVALRHLSKQSRQPDSRAWAFLEEVDLMRSGTINVHYLALATSAISRPVSRSFPRNTLYTIQDFDYGNLCPTNCIELLFGSRRLLRIHGMLSVNIEHYEC